jgi:hypothetical protein
MREDSSNYSQSSYIVVHMDCMEVLEIFVRYENLSNYFNIIITLEKGFELSTFLFCAINKMY